MNAELIAILISGYCSTCWDLLFEEVDRMSEDDIREQLAKMRQEKEETEEDE